MTPEDAASDARVAAARVQPATPLNGPVTLAEADPGWPAAYDALEGTIRAALGSSALAVHHVGSTSVPDLAAKPRIDVVLVVADSADEAAYVPALTARGLGLVVREPGWYQHRMLAGTEPASNVHVFSAGCPEVDRMLAFRDRLRSSDEDRRQYESVKRELAARRWRHVQDYADAKSAVVAEIGARAASAGSPATSGE